jgi:hypothetical protein
MTMEADQVGQEQGQGFSMELQMALQQLRDTCLCPDPVGAFDPVAARNDLDRLQPIGDPGSEAAKTFREARDALMRGKATPAQRALMIHTETINEQFGRLQDHP